MPDIAGEASGLYNRPMRKPLLALVLATVACQTPEPQGPMVVATPAPTATPPLPNDPAVRALLTLIPELPPGFTPTTREIDTTREGKFTLVLAGPFASQRMSYTVYPDAAQAAAAFTRIGDTPANRNVSARTSFAPAGFDGEVWGETTNEEYSGTLIFRTAAAVVVDRAVVLAQVVASGEASPVATTAVAALLKSAVAHMHAALAVDANPGVVTPSATVPETTPNP